ncbi:MAG: hypothetical protein D6798_20020, partial [Deltaproteobacteria bacterium]
MTTEIAGLDPLRQELAVVEIRAALPDDSAALCPALRPGRVRARCERLDPHVVPAKSAASYWLELPVGLEPPVSDPDLACVTDDVACLVEAARSAAMAGEVGAAAGACRALPAPVLVEDCMVSAAERLPP